MKYGEIWWFNQWNMVIYAGLWWFMVVYGGSYLNIYLTWFLIPHEIPHFVLVLSSTIQTFPVSDQVRSWRDRSKCPSAQHQVMVGWRCHDATEGPGEFPAFLFWQRLGLGIFFQLDSLGNYEQWPMLKKKITGKWDAWGWWPTLWCLLVKIL